MLPVVGRAPVRNARDAGRFAISRDSSRWRGRAVRAAAPASIVSDPCATCHGETRVAKEVKLNVKVPPGVEEGTRIRYSGEGDAGRSGGPSGDLYVVLSIRAHDFFQREGYDLHCVIPISFPQAALGAEIEIPAIDGAVTLKIPEGTQSGKELRVRGRGVPYLNEKGRGDLIVKRRGADSEEADARATRTGDAAGGVADGGEQAGVAGIAGQDEGPVFLGTENRE